MQNRGFLVLGQQFSEISEKFKRVQNIKINIHILLDYR